MKWRRDSWPSISLRGGTRAAYLCEYHIEHIIPRQHGGADDADNLALACPECNLYKGPNLTGIDPQTGDVVRLFHPRRHIWSDHFGYLGLSIVGFTAVGRTTATLLDMNDPERRRVRELVARIQS